MNLRFIIQKQFHIFSGIVLILLLLLPNLSLGTGFVQGVVRNSAGRAVANAFVSITSGATVPTEYNGFYQIEHTAGSSTVEASKFGYTSKNQNITITEGGTSIMNFTLQGSPLGIDSVYPSLGERGRDLDVTIFGSGYDSNTRVFMSPDSGNLAQVISHIDTLETIGFTTGDIYLLGNIAFTTNKYGMAIIDISNPLNPIIVSTEDLYHLPYWTQGMGIVVKDSIAYIGSIDSIFSSGAVIAVVDVSNLSNPELVTYYYTGSGYVDELYVSGSYLYAATMDTLHIVDISDPLDLSDSWEISPVVDENYFSVTVNNDIAYIGTNHGLRIVNVTEPRNPKDLTTLIEGINPGVISLDVVDGKLYVLDPNSLHVVNIDNPANPVVLGSFEMSSHGHNRAVSVVGSIAYIGTFNSVHKVDISDPSNLSLLGSVSTNGWSVSDLVVKDNLAYVSDNGFSVLDMLNPRKFTIVGSVETWDAQKLRILGNYLYLADEGGGPYPGNLMIIDISDASAPSVVGTYISQTDLLPPEVPQRGSVDDVFVNNNIAYIASIWIDSVRGVDIVDVTNKENPQSLGSVITPGRPVRIDLSNLKAYVTLQDYNLDSNKIGLQIIDVSNPENPVARGHIEVHCKEGGIDVVCDEWPRGIEVLDNIAYIPTPTGLVLIDVNDSYNPIQLTQIPEVPGSVIDRVGNILYVSGKNDADEFKLYVVDITNRIEPNLVGSVLFASRNRSEGSVVKGVTVSDNKAYISLLSEGYVTMDVQDPSHPYVLGYTSTPGSVVDVAVVNDLAYIADDTAGLSIIPAMAEIDSVTYDSANQLTASIPSPVVEGHYNLSVVSANDIKSLEGAVTFTDDLNLLTSKAIIVAGGGPDSGLEIWNETKAYANYAYENLIFQGYKYNDIFYLTDEDTAFGWKDYATKTNLKNAILDWAKNDLDTSDLLIYLVDHGDTNLFLMKGGPSTELLSAEELDAWLDELQIEIPGKVILIYDACKSGSFLSKVTPPLGKTRINLASSTPDQVSYFLADDHSFSSHLWSTFSGKAGKRANLLQAFIRASKNMAPYQTAQLDANGNGMPNEHEDYQALEGLEGTIYGLRRQYHQTGQSSPEILTVPVNTTLTSETYTLLSAGEIVDIDGDKIVRVWSEIIPPNYDPDSSGLTVTSLPFTQTLLDGDDDGVYEGVSPFLDVQGTYIVNYFAEDVSGNYSLPTATLIKQLSGTKNLVPDQYEDDNALHKAQPIIVDSPIPQNHSFHVSDDQDWVKFYGVAGKVYNIRAMNPTIISDPIVTLYNSSGQLVSPPVNESNPSNTVGLGEEESIIGWSCPTNGTYYVKVINNSTHFGANVRYKLWVYNPDALSLPDMPGTVSGTIVSGGVGVAGALVSGGGAQPQYTDGNGNFILFLPAGRHIITVVRDGYQTISFEVEVGSGQNISVTPNMNWAPYFFNSPPRSVKSYELYNYVPVVVDPNGNSFTFSISGKPAWASFMTRNGQLTGRPGIGDVGTHGPVTIRATDTLGAVGSVIFSIEVIKGSGGSMPGVFLLLLK